MTTSVASNELGSQLFVRLTRLDGITQQVVPLLATKWEVSADGLTWTYHLRHGAVFSDGHPLTAEDVVFSFAAIYKPKISSPLKDAVSTNGSPWAVSSPDPYTVTINTLEPSGVVPDLVSRVRILPKHVLGPSLQDGTLVSVYALTTPPEKLVTSGPWKLASYTHRERTVLVRNPYWFGVDRAGRRLPYLDQLVVVDVPEQNTANLKFQAGEVDALPTAIPENYSWYEQHAREGRFTLYDVGPSLAVSYLWFNLTRVRDAKPGKPVGSPEVDPVKFAWFNNVAFRRAVSKAIDRDAMIASVYYGSAIKSWSSATPGNTVWYTPDLAHDDYDPAEAMRLLAGLGFRDRNGDGTWRTAMVVPSRSS